MGLIYMRISPSGKYYIGRTIRPEIERWKDHVKEAYLYPTNGCWLLNQAIRKYGGENFNVKILEDNINTEKLPEREQYWIDFYDATNGIKGYNRSDGNGGHIAKAILQYDLNGKLLKEWNNIGDILIHYNWNARNLYDCLSGGYSHFHNYLWKYKDNPITIQELINKYKLCQSKRGGGTLVYCKEDNQQFSSIRALERHLNISHGKMMKMFKDKNEIEYNNLHYIKGEKND